MSVRAAEKITFYVRVRLATGTPTAKELGALRMAIPQLRYISIRELPALLGQFRALPDPRIYQWNLPRDHAEEAVRIGRAGGLDVEIV